MTVCLLSAHYLKGQHRIAGCPQTASREPLKSALSWLSARLHSDPDRLILQISALFVARRQTSFRPRPAPYFAV